MLAGLSILQAVIAQLNLTETPDLLSAKITVIPVSGSQLIRLVVKDRSPAQAAIVANTTAEVFIKHIQTTYNERYFIASNCNRVQTLQQGLQSLQLNLVQLNNYVAVVEGPQVGVFQVKMPSNAAYRRVDTSIV